MRLELAKAGRGVEAGRCEARWVPRLVLVARLIDAIEVSVELGICVVAVAEEVDSAHSVKARARWKRRARTCVPEWP